MNKNEGEYHKLLYQAGDIVVESGDLKIFQAVAREGSITKAAQALNYVQSNVTTRIQQLEAELKTPLFRRSNRGMTLTPAGENLLEYADRILSLLDEAEKSARYSEHPSGPLRIGSIETAAVTHLTPLLKSYCLQYPDVQLSLQTGETHRLMRQVLNDELDGAFIYGPVEHPDIEHVAAFRDELVLISEPGTGSLEECLAKPMLFFDVGCSHRARAERFLSESGHPSGPVMEFGTFEVILRGVSEGLGVSMLPKSSIAEAEEAGRIATHRLPHGYRDLHIWFVHRQEPICSSALPAFIAMLDAEPPT